MEVVPGNRPSADAYFKGDLSVCRVTGRDQRETTMSEAFDDYHSVIRGLLFGEPVSADNRVFLTREKYNLWQFVCNLLQSASSEIVISTAFLTFERMMRDKVWSIVKERIEAGVRVELYSNRNPDTLRELLDLCDFLGTQPMEFVRAAPQAHAKYTLIDRRLGILHTGNYTGPGLGLRKPSFEIGVFLSNREVRRIMAYRFHYQFSTDQSMPYFFWLYPEMIRLPKYLQLVNRYFDELSNNLANYFSMMSADVVEFADFDLPGEPREYFLYLQYLVDQFYQKLHLLGFTSTVQKLSELLEYVGSEILECGTDEPEDEETGFENHCAQVQSEFGEAARTLKEEISTKELSP